MSELSPVEVFMKLVTMTVDPGIVPNVVVGPLSDTQQQQGGISIMDAGSTRDRDDRTVYPRYQLRCVGPTLDRAERMGQHTARVLEGVTPPRLVITQDDGGSYLVHAVTVSGGPSAHRDSEGTWEYLVFAEAMIGVVPVS